MYYVVIDLEWNQYHNPLWMPTSRAGVKMREEIIQIGAVKTDKDMNPVDTFKMYVRLSGGRRLDRYVKKLTHISESDIAGGEDFLMAVPMFSEWLEDVEAIFSWGPDDKRVFLNNLAYHGMKAPECAWFDAQKIYSMQNPDHGSLALKNVAEALGVYVNLSLHDALNDAILTAFCMSKLDMRAGVENYSRPRKVEAVGAMPEPVCVSKTHRHTNKQAAWEEACNSLMCCPDCMQPITWSGDEKGTIDRWYKPAKCANHGEFILRGEFIGQRNFVLKLSFFKASEEILAFVESETTEAPAKKRRRRRRKKPSEQAEKPVTQEDMLSRAIAFAAEKHKSQVRKGGNVPYIVHPMEAAAIVATMTDDAALIAAAVLHDTLEDCEGVTADEIESAFGAQVCDLVLFETMDKAGLTWREAREKAIEKLKSADEEQLIVTLGDKLSNARALYRDYTVIGDKLFERFNQKDKSEQAWYYASLAEALKPLSKFEAYTEFKKLTEAVFGKSRARAKAKKPKE